MNHFSVRKILIIRFSSFGDIVQAMSVLKPLKKRFPEAQIHWVTRNDFAPVLSMSSDIDVIHRFDKKQGFLGLVQLKNRLQSEKFDLIYDAHHNLRSNFLCWFLAPYPLRFFSLIRPLFIQRSKDRIKRLLLFHFRYNSFPWPFRGMHSFIAPLKPLGVQFNQDYYLEGNFPENILSKVQSDFDHFLQTSSGRLVALIPGAAWEMKRWPVDYWKQLVTYLPDCRFVILGGPEDHFCSEIAAVDDQRILNLAGACSLLASCAILKRVDAFVSADTGLLHVGDILGIPGVALIGPTAFGFPTSPKIKVCEGQLDCRPCTKDGRGRCSHQVYQYCMTSLFPQKVAETLTSCF